MRKIHIALVLAAIFSTSAVFADQEMASFDSKPCAAIAHACEKAGFDKKGSHKKFWQDCMKPIILGKTVSGVNVDAATVKSCRSDKTEQLKKEVKELEKAS